MSIVTTGPRRTAPRRAIADLIGRRSGHFTAADLIADARASDVMVGRATIFRTLDLLTEQGALERIDLPNGEHAYVCCAPPQHHHHVVKGTPVWCIRTPRRGQEGKAQQPRQEQPRWRPPH